MGCGSQLAVTCNFSFIQAGRVTLTDPHGCCLEGSLSISETVSSQVNGRAFDEDASIGALANGEQGELRHQIRISSRTLRRNGPQTSSSPDLQPRRTAFASQIAKVRGTDHG